MGLHSKRHGNFEDAAAVKSVMDTSVKTNVTRNATGTCCDRLKTRIKNRKCNVANNEVPIASQANTGFWSLLLFQSSYFETLELPCDVSSHLAW
jgi:hypothetical protein